MGISDRSARPFRTRSVIALLAIIAALLVGASAETSTRAKAVTLPPDVTGSSPQVGPTSGGTIVTITGTGLLETQAVYFGTATATSITVIDDTMITVVTPPNEAGRIQLTLETPAGLWGPNPDRADFVYESSAPIPTITQLSPAEGSTLGGTTVTITGTDLGAVGSVLFGTAQPPSITVLSETSIVVVTPPGAPGPVRVLLSSDTATSPDSPEAVFTYVADTTTTTSSSSTTSTIAATTTTISPTTTTTIPPTTTTTIPPTTTTTIPPTTTTTIPPTTTTTTPPTTTTTTPPTTTTTTPPTTTTTTPPTTTTTTTTTIPRFPIFVNPSSGPQVGGTDVRIDGPNIEFTERVNVDGVSVPFTVIRSDTRRPGLIIRTPPHAPGTVEITVAVRGRIGAANFTFTAVRPPLIFDVRPRAIPQVGGTAVTINGRFFDQATSVAVDGVSVDFTTNTGGNRFDTLTFISPPHLPGDAAITVTTPAGTSLPVSITYTPVRPPVIRALNPSTAPQVGGTTITIFGSFLDQATSVSVDGVSVPVTRTGGGNRFDTVSFVAPPHEPGDASLTVTTPAGTSLPVNLLYTGVRPPRIRSVSQFRVSSNGSETVSILAFDILGTTSVTVDGIEVPFTVVGNPSGGIGRIDFVTPAHAPGNVPVVVSTPAGSSSPVTISYYRERPPVITDINPRIIGLNGGRVLMFGEALHGATSVSVGGIAVPFVQERVLDGRSGVSAILSFTAPPRQRGPVTVTVTTPAGASAPVVLIYDPRRF